VEASALQAPAGVARSRISIGAPLLRLRSDEQLVALFRAGNDDAFRVIHDRYRQRLFAYARQMLPGSRQDAEDALQDVFVRAYASLRSNDRELALRAWLYRVAHNRCIDELRRPTPPSPEVMELVRAPIHDPIAEVEQRESLRRLVEDVRRLPDQQRSALLMRELSGMSYLELAAALGVSVPAVKSLLVRARVTLAAAREARDTACSEIRDELIVAHDRRMRPNAMARRHLRDCAGCREFRTGMRSVSRQFAALVPALGPAAVIANLLGVGSGAAGGSAAAGSGAAAGGGAAAAGTSAFAAGGVLATGASHVATLLAAAVVTTSGAIAIQDTVSAPPKHHPRHHAKAAAHPRNHVAVAPAASSVTTTSTTTAVSTPSIVPSSPAPAQPAPPPARPAATPRHQKTPASAPSAAMDATQLDPGSSIYPTAGGAATGPTSGGASTAAGTTETSGSTDGTGTDGASTGDPSSGIVSDPTSTESTSPAQLTGSLPGAASSGTPPQTSVATSSQSTPSTGTGSGTSGGGTGSPSGSGH
jgi:RNA polymerase sigma factor (sigma-70 family)